LPSHTPSQKKFGENDRPEVMTPPGMLCCQREDCGLLVTLNKYTENIALSQERSTPVSLVVDQWIARKRLSFNAETDLVAADIGHASPAWS
jgi:hypothetical protein